MSLSIIHERECPGAPRKMLKFTTPPNSPRVRECPDAPRRLRKSELKKLIESENVEKVEKVENVKCPGAPRKAPRTFTFANRVIPFLLDSSQ